MQWLNAFKNKIVNAEEAVSVVNSNQRVYVHPGCANPITLINALTAQNKRLENVEVIHLLTLGFSPYTLPEMEGSFRHNALFIGHNVRQAVNEGRADFTPIFLSEVPSLFYKNILPIDVALIQVSPPDRYGYCSFGVGTECTRAATDTAKIIIAQVNPNMPRTLGNTFIHVDKIDFFVEVEEPLQELKDESKLLSKEEAEVFDKIGSNVANLIENGSTLQMGIGAIPHSVLKHLSNKKDLGIHTELFSDAVIPLIESGIINGEKKSIHRGKIISSFVLGTKKLFEYIDNAPNMEFHPSDYTNDPFVISQNEKMVAINSALEVDLTGQVCADSIGTKFYSGFGGQVDFIRGASRSKGGKPIIALPSTAKNDSITRIVPILAPGAGVTTSKGDVHFVVTEYGVADLYGKTIRERMKSLIEIAHPNFREDLERAAFERTRKIQFVN